MSCYLLLIVAGNKFFLVTVIEMQLIYAEQQMHLNLLKDNCVVLPELRCDLTAKIKRKFPISISHDYLGRTARIDKLEFTGLCLELVLATKLIEHMGTAVRMLNTIYHLTDFCARSAHPGKSLALYLLEAPSLNVI